jgi:hypothetical protein
MMAKQTKKSKPTKPGGVVSRITPRQPPSQEEFKRARELLRQRADAVVLELAASYVVSGGDLGRQCVKSVSAHH